MKSSDDRFEADLERLDERLAEGQELSEEIDLDGAGRVLNLINRVRLRHPDTTASNLFGSTSIKREDRRSPSIAANITGQRIGSYVVEQQIARGGMGVVLRAHDTTLNRTVALKMMLAGPFAGAEERERFCREAEAAARLDHVGIVPIYDVGLHDGQPYFTMGFVQGESLAERVRRDPLQASDAARLAKQIAHAVDYAHQQRVIHRDIKPSNVLLSEDGQVKITDFGLARWTDSDRSLTATDQVLGTPSYMSPEQAGGFAGSAGPLADVYSIGATLYCMMTGRPPFQASAAAETIRMVLDEDPLAPTDLNPSIPRDLNTICLKCLQKEPSRRYQSAGELAEDLQRFLNHEPIAAHPVGRLEKSWKWARKRPAIATLLGILLVAISSLIIGGAIYQRKLSQTIEELNFSRATAVDNLYRSLTSEAEFLNDARPIGYGARVEGLISQAAVLETELKDPFQLRQLAISGLGYSGSRQRIDFPIVAGTIRSGNVLTDANLLLTGLEDGQIISFDIDSHQKHQKLQVLDVPIIRIDVNKLNLGVDGKQIRVVGHRGQQIATLTIGPDRQLRVDSIIEPRLPKDFLGLEVTPDGRNLVGIQPASQRHFDDSFWLSSSLFRHGDRVTDERRRPPGEPTARFAVVSLQNPDFPIKTSSIEMSPRFGVSNHYLAVGRSWLDDPSIDGGVEIYNLHTGESTQKLNSSCGALLNVQISENGYYVGVGSQHGFEVFQRNNGTQLIRNDEVGGSLIECFPGLESDVVVRTDRDAVWYSPRSNRPIARFNPQDRSTMFRFASDHRHLIWTGTDQPSLLDTRGDHRIRIPAHSMIAKSVSYSTDGRLLISSTRLYGGNLSKVWDTESGELLFEFVGSESEFSPNGKWIAAWSEGFLRLWNVADGTLAGKAPFAFPQTIRFSPDSNRIVAAAWTPGDFQVWQIETPAKTESNHRKAEVRLHRILHDEAGSAPVAFNPSGTAIAFRNNQTIRIHRFGDDQSDQQLPHEGQARTDSMIFLDDNRLLIAGKTLQTWNIAEQRWMKTEEQRRLPPLVYSPDRKYLLCRRSLLLTDGLKPVFELPSALGSVASGAWNPNGRQIAFGFSSGDVMLWNLDRIDQTVSQYGLTMVGFKQIDLPEHPSVSEMIRVGTRHAGQTAPQQWLDRYNNLIAQMDRGAESWWIVREVNWLQQRIGIVATRPFFSARSTEEDTFNRLNHVYALARRLQSLAEYNAELELLESTLIAFEKLDAPTPGIKRVAARLHHAIGDLTNFFLHDPAKCLAAYASEETLLNEVENESGDQESRESLADSRFWLHRNLALALKRKGDTGEAVKRMSRALQLGDEFPALNFNPEIIRQAQDDLSLWQAELSQPSDN